ncbi:MAG: translation elongation factor Ts [Lentisphaeria bacterium]|nr:translation elongation factor Ts [Lentisphaeria bacterium]
MADITAKMVMELRQKTGCGMMECKKALVESNGDVDGAIENLRKAGIAKAQKRAGRAVNQGRWAVAAAGDNCVALVEALCETDFVANTAEFKAFVQNAANCALACEGEGDVSEKVAAAMDAELKALIGKIGENMSIRRAIKWTAAAGNKLAYYLHTAQPYATLVEVAGTEDAGLLLNIALHITASNPTYISQKDVPAEFVAKEREIAAADPRLAGKPEAALEKILQGKLAKRYTEICLMDMPWIDDEHTTLAKVAPNVSVVRFVRWLVGEEIAK